MQRVGLKYCGGCNPAYDRVEYVARLREAARGRIDWAAFEEGGYSVLLIASGCDRRCAEEAVAGRAAGGYDRRAAGMRIVSVRDAKKSPKEIVPLLLDNR